MASPSAFEDPDTVEFRRKTYSVDVVLTGGEKSIAKCSGLGLEVAKNKASKHTAEMKAYP